MRVSVIIPSLGAKSLGACLEALGVQDQRPDEVLLVLSGGAPEPSSTPDQVRVLRARQRMGFAAAVNRGLEEVSGGIDAVALLNDDAFPSRQWLAGLSGALGAEEHCASVQGTVLDARGLRIDGRGILVDRFGVPGQIDHGRLHEEGESGRKRIPGVSATAALYRLSALESVRLGNGKVFDEAFDSYHEDVDLALRLLRAGWTACWQSGATALHLGSATGGAFRFRHAWWLLSNRWRVLFDNCSWTFLAAILPRLLRGEVRCLRELLRRSPVAPVVAPAVWIILPWIALASRFRRDGQRRLHRFPETPF